VLLGAIPPLMLKTDANPGGLPIEVFNGLRDGLSADRSQFYKDLSAPFYGANRAGNTVSQGLRDSFWRRDQGRDVEFLDELDRRGGQAGRARGSARSGHRKLCPRAGAPRPGPDARGPAAWLDARFGEARSVIGLADAEREGARPADLTR
jgi:hypothetical protein